jgi:hypothetical protein
MFVNQSTTWLQRIAFPRQLPPAPMGFVAVTLPMAGAAGLQSIYQLAYEQAKRRLEKPRYIERFFSVWN